MVTFLINNMSTCEISRGQQLLVLYDPKQQPIVHNEEVLLSESTTPIEEAQTPVADVFLPTNTLLSRLTQWF